MKFLVGVIVALLGLASHGVAQSKAPSSCSRHDHGDNYASGNFDARYFIEVCKVPNDEGKPALSIVFSSTPDGDNAMRIYSNAATKPLILDGVYIERKGEKKFILHRDEIEWADGSRTRLDALDPKKRTKLVEVVDAAFALLKDAAEFRRIPMRNSQDRLNLWRVFNFMFNYQLNSKQ